jgi:hypothetical protein
MRVFAHAVAICGLVAVFPRAASITAQAPPKKDPAAILAQAREALGGEKRLSAVKTFMATGRTRQVRGDNLVPIEFEIACELPDKYVRKDEIPAQESGPTSTGFNGDELIQLPVPAMPTPPPQAAGPPRPQGGEGGGRAAAPAGQPGTPPAQGGAGQMEAMRNARVAAVKQDFVRLTLGMFASSFSSYPLTFTYVGQAEAPQGSADVLDVKGPANFSARLFINSQTHLPIMVSWQASAGRGRGPGGGPGAGRGGAPGAGRGEAPGAARGEAPGAARGEAPGAARGEAPAGSASTAPAGGGPPAAAGARGAAPPPAASVESRIYYGDYRDVDGMQWPFRVRRATGPDTTEETIFDRFRINTKIDPKKFEVRK